ncbi:MAG: DNA polymerase IV [Gemmatimonadota bacterium]
MSDQSGRPARPRTILHVDMDAFFAAVEIREDPSLEGRPVVIGSDPRNGSGRGVVSTANYEARRFGIHSAMPISQAWRRCPNAAYVRPRISLYSEVSRSIFEIFESFTDRVEGLSLDEAFLDVTASRDLFGDGPTIARAVKDRIEDVESLTASVGVASSKYVAKVASDLDKPDGLVVVPVGGEREFLAPLDLSRLWGAGAVTQERLRGMGLRTIGDVARLGAAALEAALGPGMGGRFHSLANGLDHRGVNRGSVRKSLSKEVTFGTDQGDRERVERTLFGLCDGVARSLRRKSLAGRTVHLKLRWDGFETHTRQRTLDEPAMTTERIWPVARQLFRELDDERRLVRLIGVGVTGFNDDPARQLSMFEGGPGAEAPRTNPEDSDVRIAGALDALNDRFGRDAVTRAALLDRTNRSDA